ncbi:MULTISPECIES: hypothetical protein [Microbacterium]|nr:MULTISPECIES: hypothetical protein [Microbacterium]
MTFESNDGDSGDDVIRREIHAWDQSDDAGPSIVVAVEDGAA